MVSYVSGLLFSYDKSKVVLIKKARPSWQKGRLNAVGGHIEEGETPARAMHREFLEETGLDIPESAWELVVTMKGPNWDLHFYRTWGDPSKCSTQDESEPINVYSLNEVKLMRRPTIIGNLSWLVPLCLDTTGGLSLPVEIDYKVTS